MNQTQREYVSQSGVLRLEGGKIMLRSPGRPAESEVLPTAKVPRERLHERIGVPDITIFGTRYQDDGGNSRIEANALS